MSGTSDFDIEVEDFAGAAPSFAGAADDIGDTLKTCRSDLASLGACWGSNAHGPTFGETYQKAQALLLDLAQGCVLGLQGMSDGLAEMAKNYNITEDENTSRFKRWP